MPNNNDILFSPYDLQGKMLRNRLVMAPLTRNRATPGSDAPHALNAEYYAQRADDAGLIITEASQISPTAKGYAWTPGIYSAEQIAGWKQVTEAVHQKQGVIYLQLWHVGRISHPSLQPGGQLPVGPSAIAPVNQRTFIENGSFAEIGTPRALTVEDIANIVEDYRIATRNAMEAGFDGVEIHAANGYLIQQFFSERANQRNDQYGGSIDNRIRFALEVTDAVIGEIGAHRTGIRLSPVASFNDCAVSSPATLYFPFLQALNDRQIAYVHAIEGQTGGARDFQGFDFHQWRKIFNGAWMVNNGYNLQMATDAISSGYANLVAFGTPYLANPDLCARFKANAPLNQPDQNTFYGGGAKGYTDYPRLKP